MCSVNDLLMYLDSGEISYSDYEFAKNIIFDINFEDLALFINGIDIPLADICRVEYSWEEFGFDGCYIIYLDNNDIVFRGWYDNDRTGKLYKIN